MIEFISKDNKYKLNIHNKIDRRKKYMVSVLISCGFGKDNTAIVVMEKSTLKPVAEFSSNVISIKDLKNFILDIGRYCIPKPELILNKEAVSLLPLFEIDYKLNTDIHFVFRNKAYVNTIIEILKKNKNKMLEGINLPYIKSDLLYAYITSDNKLRINHGIDSNCLGAYLMAIYHVKKQ